MKKILLTNKYTLKPLEILTEIISPGFELIMLENITETELKDKVKDADYILASGRLKINKEVLDNAPNVKMIQRTGVGLDSLDLEVIKQRNIDVYVNRGINAISVAEHTIMLMLACLRRLLPINQNLQNGVWKKQVQGITTRELNRLTVGIIGMGQIGRRVAEILKVFGVEILYYSRRRICEESELNISYCDKNEIFRKSDIITLHCPDNKETHNMICKETLSMMKKSSIIINTARGGLMNEEDLLWALKNDEIAGVGIDVFEKEPTDNIELIKNDKVIATPHIGGVTYDSFYKMMKDAIRNIELYDKGRLEEIEQYRLEL